MPRNLHTWDPETHEAVLLALVDHMKPSGGDWNAVVAAIRPAGYTFTASALMYVSPRPRLAHPRFLSSLPLLS